jgi:hypothetical protein
MAHQAFKQTIFLRSEKDFARSTPHGPQYGNHLAHQKEKNPGRGEFIPANQKKLTPRKNVQFYLHSE